MSELNFVKVFNELKAIEANSVSREKYNQSQNEVKKLESLLVEANNRFLQKTEELIKLKGIHEQEVKELKKLKMVDELKTMEIDVIKAEKQSLEAEKKTLEVRFDEVSLKLKLKNHQYEMLAGQQSNNEVQSTKENPQSVEKKTIGTQTVKEEPSVGAVNEPSSLPKQSCKRPASEPPLILRIKAKRKKTDNREKIFSCDECLVEWGRHMHFDFDDFNHPDAPNPYERIAMFSSSEDLKNHYQQAHEWYRDSKFCGETDCLHTRGHNTSNTSNNYPHGDNICGYMSSNGKKCGRSFKFKNQLKEHKKIIHANIESKTRKEIFDLFRLIENNHDTTICNEKY